MAQTIFRFLVSLACCSLLTACTDTPYGVPEDPERAMQMDRMVRQNMRTVQIAAEHYAADHGGNNYPTVMDDVFKTYFPGGEDGRRPSPIGMVNPFTATNEFPLISPVVKNVQETRNGKRFAIPPGQVIYSVLDGGKSYAIVGGAHDGKVLMDENNPDQVLVFSNI